jgi:hypothetical protein
MKRNLDPSVRRGALGALKKAGKDTLTVYAGTIASFLTDPELCIAALDVFYRSEFGKLTLALIKLVRSGLTNMLDNESIHVRIKADIVLESMKKKLVHYLWETARAFVDEYRVRPYVLFWYEYVGKPLCAPGGKWEARDRAAYQNEFSELIQ